LRKPLAERKAALRKILSRAKGERRSQTMKFMLKHAVAAIILVLGFATPVVAGPLEDANAAIKRRDYANALQLIRPLAEKGDANAQYNLGVFYDNGLGVPQDKVRAYMWFNLSAAQGREGAAAFRDLIARRMTPAQIAEAQKLAHEWKPNTQSPSR
jgi:TPR repeat protein